VPLPLAARWKPLEDYPPTPGSPRENRVDVEIIRSTVAVRYAVPSRHETSSPPIWKKERVLSPPRARNPPILDDLPPDQRRASCRHRAGAAGIAGGGRECPWQAWVFGQTQFLSPCENGSTAAGPMCQALLLDSMCLGDSGNQR